MWGLGIFQAVIITVLSLRLRKLDELIDCNGQPSDELRQKIIKMQRRIKWLYGCSSVLFVAFSTLLITLSDPINGTLSEEAYYNIHVYQLATVTLVLLFGLFYISTRVKLI